MTATTPEPASDGAENHVSAATEPLIRSTLTQVAGALDVHQRAWIVGGVALADAPEDTEGNRVELDTLIDSAFSADHYPAVPFPFHRSEISWRQVNTTLIGGRHTNPDDEIQFDVNLVTDRRAWLGEAMTRAVLDSDGVPHPTHVMLSDAEAVLADALSLGRSLASTTGYTGAATLVLEIVCESEHPPLELRAFDEALGKSLRPETGFSHFVPVRVPLHFPLSDEDEAQLLWQTSSDIATQFGVFDPQLIEHP